MSDDSGKSEKIADVSKDQKSSNTEAQFEWEDEIASLPLYEAVQDTRYQMDTEGLTENLTFRDANLSALMRGLEETDQLTDIAAKAEASLDRDSSDAAVSISNGLRLLVRVGLQEVAPETIQIATEANKDYLVNNMNEF